MGDEKQPLGRAQFSQQPHVFVRTTHPDGRVEDKAIPQSVVVAEAKGKAAVLVLGAMALLAWLSEEPSKPAPKPKRRRRR
jgi:hypothetical protein